MVNTYLIIPAVILVTQAHKRNEREAGKSSNFGKIVQK